MFDIPNAGGFDGLTYTTQRINVNECHIEVDAGESSYAYPIAIFPYTESNIIRTLIILNAPKATHYPIIFNY